MTTTMIVCLQVIFETPGSGQLPLQQEIMYPTHPPGSVLYDEYDNYPTTHRPSRIDDGGVYRGEIQLDSMTRGRSGGSYGDQETRFM